MGRFNDMKIIRGWRLAGVANAVLLASCTTTLAVSSAVNISTRMIVGTGNDVLIAGFIVNGTGQKQICVRALGPSLPVPDALQDPVLELHDASGALVTSNNNWRTSQQNALIAAHLNPSNDLESALIASVNGGSHYTAIVRGANNTTGVGLIEAYDLTNGNVTTRLANISTRGKVLTNDNVMIAGFIVLGDSSKQLILRVRGPSLVVNGQKIPGSLSDPMLELHDSRGALIAQNDNWRSNQASQIIATGLQPTDTHEPAIISTLTPGAYTAIVRGVRNMTGIALVEAYDLDPPPKPNGSILFIAQLRGQIPGAQGSGLATLRLSDDGKTAIVTFQFGNLSSPVTGMHVHGPNGEIIFDVDDATPQADGSYIWNITAVGTLSANDIATAIRTGHTYFNIHTANNPTGEIKGFFGVAKGGSAAPTPTPPPPLASGTPSIKDASRFLTQATFGTTESEVTNVQHLGFDGWLNQQFAKPVTSHATFVLNAGHQPSLDDTMNAWWTTAITAPDQLRQRVAFALSEILVVSTVGSGLDGQPLGMSTYVDTLLRDCFGNYRKLLEDITLNPCMGIYLDMLGNDRVEPGGDQHPNENFAREIMQLFSVGLYRLNLDGSLTFDSLGRPIATYGQGAVSGLASVFTGWTFAGRTQFYDQTDNYVLPMMVFPEHHQPEAKTILSGVVVPANRSPAEDLKLALDTIFKHPNVGPFICRQLIQRLVTSNPSPGYLYRVVSVFNNNGQGVRGDFKAVIRAILMDYDARGAEKGGMSSGRQREPVVRLTNLLRAFHATSNDNIFSIYLREEFGQTPLQSPTVFNFFSPDYAVPGAIAANGLKSPEFQITTETSVVEQANELYSAIFNPDYPLDLSVEMGLASNPTALIDRLNTKMMNGTMSSAMRSVLIQTITQISANNPDSRVKSAIYLIVNSPEFVIDK
jgi:uncharacterized protein (DUF1800 family)